MIYTLTQDDKEHNADRLQDALIEAGLAPVSVEYGDTETVFTFPDGTAEEDVQGVVDAYTFEEPPAQPNVSPFRAIIVTVDLTHANPAVNAAFPPDYIVFLVLATRASVDLTTVAPGGGIVMRVAGGDDDSTFVDSVDVADVPRGPMSCGGSSR